MDELSHELSKFEQTETIIQRSVPELKTDSNGETYSVSYPVITKQDDKYYLGVFVYCFNAEHIKAEAIPRPTTWALLDMETGEIVMKYATKDKEFSNTSYKRLYSIVSDDDKPTSEEYRNKTYMILDEVRRKYLRDGAMNLLLYKAYLIRLLKRIPREFRKFYIDLSI